MTPYLEFTSLWPIQIHQIGFPQNVKACLDWFFLTFDENIDLLTIPNEKLRRWSKLQSAEEKLIFQKY